ncbi:uncharacterized protein PSFLO_06793 [Pseudozyma flocculosa]|uniref:Amidohydrolase-related domain-containing protein n=1 Tax=Pseudozyma flocculosa TaxID=84751 RepID=A0A5C3FCW1_9BASI|nr:uncharacterized protein PSFLO_06793 [Pseudozyma flocculosa]
MVVYRDDKSLPLWEAAGQLPTYETAASSTGIDARRRPMAGRILLKTTFVALLGFLSLASLVSFHSSSSLDGGYRPTANPHLQEVFARSLDRCRQVAAPAGPPPGFHDRTVSDRFEKGTRDILVRNATIWTGEDDGTQVLEGYDVHVSKGIIQKIEKTSHAADRQHADKDVEVIDAAGRWLTPGLVDMHVHLAISNTPSLSATEDTNSIGANINPWLRTADAMNQQDTAFRTSIAGGVVAGLVLPGSANSMGGQAFPIKYRPVSTHIPSDRIIDPPTSLTRLGPARSNSSSLSAADTERELLQTGMARNDSSSSFRHMKMAYGENPRRVYSKTRMDEAWDMRQIFDEATTLKNQQDAFCAKAQSFAALHGADAAPMAEADATFPDSLRLEALVDLLRGKLLLNTHIYTSADFDAMIRHSHEWKFPIASFHHAQSAYLIPELLRKTYGNSTPAISIFQANHYYKQESYAGTPLAGAILDSYGIVPIYKSDHPVTDSRRILNQAAQAHHFGLRESVAMRSVITAPAEKLGLGHRLGYVRKGWDADLVIWNNHPLAIGATPAEVVVDGIPQLGRDAHVPAPFFPEDAERRGRKAAPPAPASANYTEAIERVKASTEAILTYQTDPFPTAREAVAGCTVLRNVSKVYSKAKAGQDGASRYTSIQAVDLGSGGGVVVVEGGKVTCQGHGDDCASACASPASELDIRGGVVTPGLTSYGADLGLTDIISQSEASDGSTFDPLESKDSLASETSVSLRRWPLARAADGLQWGGRDLKRARASGVTTAVVAPQAGGFFSGISVRFDTGARTVLDDGAVKEEEVAVHVTLNHNSNAPSVSEQIAWIRQLLSGLPAGAAPADASAAAVWAKVARGELPLVVTALKASQIATLLKLADSFPSLRLVLSGATEAHLVAADLAKRKVPVILIPQTWPRTWDELQGLVGPPLTASTTLSALLDAGVKVALKIEEGWQASTLLFDSIRAALETDGKVDKRDALGLVSSAVEDVLGLQPEDSIVVWDGEPFEYGVKAVAVAGHNGLEMIV